MKLNYLKIVLSILCIVIGISASAQSTIQGKVIDSEVNDPLVGATVQLKGTQKGVVTDFNGLFTISNDMAFPWTIEISFVGFKTETVTVENSEQTINVNLQPDANQLDDIVITANKRAQSSQKVAMSISTISPKVLQRSGSENFEDFASGIPNLSFAPQGGTTSGRAGTNVTIRGVTGQNTTAMYLDDTPLPENIDIRLLDVARVEILKGPQGTLYGSRNMGGAVKTITKQPNTRGLEGSVNLSGGKVKEGDFDYSVAGIVNVPFNDKLALRVGGFYDFQSGVYDRVFTHDANIRNLDEHPEFAPLDKTIENVDDVSQYGFHVSLGFFPTDKISIIPKIILQSVEGDGYDFAEVDVDSFTQTRASNIDEGFNDDWIFYSLTAQFELGKGTIVSSTSFLDRKIKEKEDTGEATSSLYGYPDFGPDFYAGIMYRDIEDEQFNQEIRFTSNFQGNFEFTAGGFYSNGKSQNNWNSWLENLATDFGEPEDYDTYIFDGTYENTELAFFTEVYYNITDKLRATVGLRYFDAEVTAVTFEDGFNAGGRTDINGVIEENGFTPKFNLTYDISSDKLIYATVAKGYRLGGVNDVVNQLFNSENDDAILAQLPGGVPPETYESDYLWNYEIGFKATWANGKFRSNFAFFYNDWQNLQQAQSLDSGYSFFSNVGAAVSKGFEIDLRAKVSKTLELSGGLGYVNATIEESGDYLTAEAGDKIQFTPEITGNFVIDYNKELSENSTLYANLTYQYVGERLNTFEPERPENSIHIYGAYDNINTRVGLEYKNYDFSLYAKNLTNKQANYGSPRAFSGEVPGRPRYSTNRPLTIGLEAVIYF